MQDFDHCSDHHINPVIVLRECPSLADALHASAALIEELYPGNTYHISAIEVEPYASEELSAEAWKATVMSSELPEPHTYIWKPESID